MANTDAPHGLGLVGTTHGGAVQIEELTKDSAEAAAIYRNDVVKREADGNIAANTAGTIASGVALNHGPASTQTTHLVAVDPFAIFEAQDNSDTDGFAAADMGLNCDLEYNAGNSATLLSGHEIDESTIAVTATLDVHLRRLLPILGNEYGAFSRIEITFNKHRYMPGTVGV